MSTGRAAVAGGLRASVPTTRHALSTAAGVTLGITVLGVALGWTAVPPDVAESLVGTRAPRADVVAIGGGNLATVLLLFSGVVTGGLTTVVAALLVATFVGATLHVGVAASGWDLLGQVGAYAPLEFAGMLLAAAAGLVPVVSAALPPRPATGATATTAVGPGAPARYVAAVGPALVLLVPAVALVALGAVVEALVVSAR